LKYAKCHHYKPHVTLELRRLMSLVAVTLELCYVTVELWSVAQKVSE